MRILLTFALCCILIMPFKLSANNGYNTIKIKRIETFNNSIINKILRNEIYHNQESPKSNYFTLSIADYKEGTLIKITKQNNDIFDSRSLWCGYYEIDNNIVIVNPWSNIIKPYLDNSSPDMSININKLSDNNSIEDIKYYYIVDDIYAYLSPEYVWIWSDGKPDE